LYGESITLIIGFRSGAPVNIYTSVYDYTNSTVSIGVSGDDAGLIASKMLDQWTLDGGLTMTQDGMGDLDAELAPHDQSAAWLGFELYYPRQDGPDGPPASTTCLTPAFRVYYHNESGVLTDELLDQGSAKLKLYVIDDR
jgi:hypothetical protein